MNLSENLLKVTRNFVLCHYLSGFFLFVFGWWIGLSETIVFGVPFLFYSLAFYLSRKPFQSLSWKTFLSKFRSLPFLARAILLTFLVLNFLFSLLPPAEHVEADSLLYNLTIPWQYYLRGAIVPLDWSMNDKFSLYLPLAQLPFTVATFPWVIKVWVIFALPCLLAVCWSWTKFLRFSREEGAWILAFISALALLIKQYGAANFDIINTVYTLFGFYYLVRAIKSEQYQEVTWGAILLGMACAAKTFYIYLAFVWLFAFTIWKIFLSRQPFKKWDVGLVFLPFVGAIFFMSPFLIRNTLMVGNPMFPLLTSLFGPVIEFKLHTAVVYQHAHLGYGYGQSLIDFVLMPFRMIWPIPNPIMKFDYWTDPILLLFLIGAVVSWRRQWREERGLILWIAFFIYTFLFYGSQQARYFYPFWIFTVLLGADVVFRWFGKKLLRVVVTGQALLGIVCFGFFHRDALSHLKYLPQGKYLEKASFSYVWNQTLHQNLNGKKIKQLCLRMRPEDSIIDLFYFTVPMKILGHTTSILPLDARFTEDCDQFMIGMQWPHNLINSPIGRGMVVDKERYLHETFSK